MKKLLYGIVFCVSMILSACSQTRNIQGEDYYSNEPSNSISYQQFYDDLSPYGQWMNNPEFGNVWVPRQAGFRPYYSDGYWAYTNYGWTWVSNYNWGWAPFHYGSWYYDDFYGWAWVPGYEWAPAWVNWRSNSQYYGWAPQCPRRRDGSYYYQVRNDQWAFVPQRYINQRNINNYYISPQNNTTIINNTREINKVRVINNNTRYPVGPSVTEVEKVTNSRIRPLAVKPSPVPGTKVENGTIRIFKPVVKANNNNTAGTNANINPQKTIERKNVPEAAQPVNQTPQTNNNTIPASDKIKRQLNDGKLNNNQTKINPAQTNNAETDNDNRQLAPLNKTIRQLPNEQNQPNRNVRQNLEKMRPANNNDQAEQMQRENIQRAQEIKRQQEVEVEQQQARELQRKQEAQEVQRQQAEEVQRKQEAQEARRQQQAQEIEKQRQAQERTRRVPQENRTNINVPQRRFENPRDNSDKGYQRERMINNNRQQNPSFERRSQAVPNNLPAQAPLRFDRQRDQDKK